MAHPDHWGEEPQPVSRDLRRLNAAESALFDDLRHKRLQSKAGISLRLEQERIDFGWLLQAIAALQPLNIVSEICL